MKVLIPNPPGARRETVSIFHNMQIIQNGRHDVIDLHISLVFWHKQIYLMASCQYRGAESKSAGSQTWNLEYSLKYANYSKWPPWRHVDKHISLVFCHKQIYLMAFCQYRGAESKSTGSQTWNLEYSLKYANYSKWLPWRHRQTHLPCFLT